PAHPDIHTLSLHDALPIYGRRHLSREADDAGRVLEASDRTGHPDDRREADHEAPGEGDADEERRHERHHDASRREAQEAGMPRGDRKSTRLNSSHDQISYA